MAHTTMLNVDMNKFADTKLHVHIKHNLRKFNMGTMPWKMRRNTYFYIVGGNGYLEPQTFSDIW